MYCVVFVGLVLAAAAEFLAEAVALYLVAWAFVRVTAGLCFWVF